MASDAALLSAAAAEGALKHAHYFQGGVIGGELLTLSKHPITEASMQGQRRVSCSRHGTCFMSSVSEGHHQLVNSQGATHMATQHRPWPYCTECRHFAWRQAHFLEYQAAGDPAAITHGDYYAGKGVGLVRLATPVCFSTLYPMCASRASLSFLRDSRQASTPWHA